jgi:hypothetical protein
VATCGYDYCEKILSHAIKERQAFDNQGGAVEKVEVCSEIATLIEKHPFMLKR